MTLAECFFTGTTIVLSTLLWLSVNEYRRACEGHVKSLQLSNDNIKLMIDLVRALPEPQLPHGNGQAEKGEN